MGSTLRKIAVSVSGNASSGCTQQFSEARLRATPEPIKLGCSYCLRHWAMIFLLNICIAAHCSPLKATPQRIISLGPSITEQLYSLGAQDKLIACTVYCKRPEEAETKEKVATAIEVNLEKVIALKPDLILATSLTDSEAIEKLRSLGIKVISFPSAESFDEICEQFLELAGIVGEEKKAGEILREVKTEVNSIKEKIKNSKRLKVFVQVGANPLFTMTKNSYANDIIEFAGGINIAKDAGIGLYSREEVLGKNPDVIIIVTMGITAEAEKEIWGKYKVLKAAKDKRIYIMDSYKFCSPTPVSFVEALKELVEVLHRR